MESESQIPPFHESERESTRPIFLSILCILTFIGNSILFLFSLILLLFTNTLMEFISQNGMNVAAYMTNGSVRMTAITSIILSIASIIAAIKMWHLQKFGFWIYLTVQCVSILLSFSVISILINALFVLLYYANYKYFIKL